MSTTTAFHGAVPDNASFQGYLDGTPEQASAAQALALELKTLPLDEHNCSLLDQVHPVAWTDPDGDGVYNMIAIGAGAGGLVTSAASSRKNAKVALIEADLLGGDCLNIGCVPSKALLASAKRVHMLRSLSDYGITVDMAQVGVDFAGIMARLRKIRTGIAENDSQQRFTGLGVDLYFGRGRFTSPNTISVNGKELKFKKACIATGGRAQVPAIPGLKEAPYLTNATVFNLTKLPESMAIIGAGAIGCELSQAFACLGSKVSLFYRSAHVLKNMDSEAAAVVEAALVKDGVRLASEVVYERVEVVENKAAEESANPYDHTGVKFHIHYSRDGEKHTLVVDQLLVAAGRTPNVENLGLAEAGVAFTRTGVTVNDQLQTTNPNIYAVGDVCLPIQLTHMAGETAGMVVHNAFDAQPDALAEGDKVAAPRLYSELLVPSAVYTFPEVAAVGLQESDLIESKTPFHCFNRPFAITDRNIADGDTQGFCKVFTRKDSDEILGATICGSQAGEMLTTISLAMKNKLGAKAIGAVIVPYPTMSENVKYCCGRYNGTETDPEAAPKWTARMKALREQ